MATLTLGSKGKDVVALQLLLNRTIKDPRNSMKADGVFGPKTKEALLTFQKSNGLKADGIVGLKTWEALGVRRKPSAEPSHDAANVPWYQIARAELGVTEDSKLGQDNKRILEYHATTTLKAKTDEVPWCSSFVNWVMTQAGIKGTNNALAKSWVTWGLEVKVPFKGAVVVLKRKNKNSDVTTGSPTGYHVGFFESVSKTTIKILGGNQSNKVKYTTFYLRSYDVVAYRKPLSAAIGKPLSVT